MKSDNNYVSLVTSSSEIHKLHLYFLLGSAITGPVAKECAELWPRIASNASSIQ